MRPATTGTRHNLKIDRIKSPRHEGATLGIEIHSNPLRHATRWLSADLERHPHRGAVIGASADNARSTPGGDSRR